MRTYIGLGANIGSAADTIGKAIRALAALPGATLVGVSRLYATEPVGLVNQAQFRNAVAALDVPAGPDAKTAATALLIALKQLERAFGRQRRERWGPRELDLDLLVFGSSTISVDRPPEGESNDRGEFGRLLVVPHPEAHQRLFVLAPLADLAPQLEPPGWGETVEAAMRRQQQREGDDAVRPVARWEDERGWLPLPE